MKLFLTLLFALSSHAASAVPSLSVAKFTDGIISTKCSVHKIPGKDLTTEMQRKLTAIFSRNPDLRVMNLVRTDIRPAPQYVVSGTLRSFDQCLEAKVKNIKVAIEIRVFDNRTGKLALTYTGSANATGAGSELGQTAQLVLNDLAFRVQRALLERKTAVRII